MSALVFWKLAAIFLIASLGWIVGKLRWLGDGDPARTLSNAAFYIFVPALLFRTTSRIDFAQLDPALVLAFFLPVLGLMLGVYVAERHRNRGGRLAVAAPSVRAISAVFGNTVQVGIPIAAALFGEAGLAIHVTIVSLHALTLLTVLTFLVEVDLARERHREGTGARRLWRTLATTMRNTIIHPVVLPVLAGLAWNASGLALPPVADETLATLGSAVVPLCLVLIGMSLAYYGLEGTARAAIGLALLKLLMLPALVLAVARWGFGLTGMPLAVIVVMAALPVGSNALIFSQRYETLQAEASATIVFSTLAFVATGSLWLALLAALD
ncbi:AEC family transporter [Piscinibacter koreensis]|uniref:AEC family transporter n=1 Tax=Piscinibacter koreensis TaxID=2742824 RepID=A0A7Y6NK10_9BURK|nr:AEC family transporter [Schlegelella koreensis]NUZ04606.1 AEC family transporter [Schlegelella koreensis]